MHVTVSGRPGDWLVVSAQSLDRDIGVRTQRFEERAGHALLLNAADLGLATAAAHTSRGALCSAGSALASRNALELGSCPGFALPALDSTPT